MNAREKKLAAIVGGILGIIIISAGIRAVVFLPLRELDKRAAATRSAIAKAQEERRNFFSAEDKVKSFARRTFADSVDRASAASGELITKQLLATELKESDFTRLPLGPRKLRGAANEIGWSVQGQGPLTNVVNLLFSLGSTAHLKQIDGLTITPGEAPGVVKVRFRYLTLVIDPAPDVERTNLVASVNLESPERAALDVIAARDLLRPYIKRKPQPPQAKPPESAPTEAAPGPETFKVVSLSDWDGPPEAHILDSSNKTRRFVPGNELAGGKIVMIDHRPLPHPTRSRLSLSRLILKIGDEYWAVELGSTLAEKRLLEKKDLPPELASSKE